MNVLTTKGIVVCKFCGHDSLLFNRSETNPESTKWSCKKCGNDKYWMRDNFE